MLDRKTRSPNGTAAAPSPGDRSPARPAPPQAELSIQRTPEPGAPVPAPSTGPGGGLLVDDSIAPLPFQLTRSAFLSTLRAALSERLEAALAGTGFTSESCPYISYWMAYYAGRSAADVERAVRQYTGVGQPADAGAYVAAAVERVVAGVTRWRASGEVEGAPSAGDESPEASADAAAVQSLRDGAAPPVHAPPRAVQRALGPGSPLPADARRRMEAGFGEHFGDVRVHTDAAAGRLAGGLSARAFAVGQHIAFAPGRFEPGTIRGDLVLAHELAHTLQQRGAGAAAGAPARESPGLERAADGAAAQAVLAARPGARDALPAHLSNLDPALLEERPLPRTGGLAISRCESCSSEEEREQTPQPTPPEPTPPEPVPAPAPRRWWEEKAKPEDKTARALYFRPVTLFERLEQLLRQVDVQLVKTGGEVLKKAPGKKLSDKYLPGSLSFTQWTSPEVKKEIEAIFPPGSDTFVSDAHIERVRKVVQGYRDKHPGAFSMMQGTETAQGEAVPADDPACINTMNKSFERLYGSRTLMQKHLADQGDETIAKLDEKKLVAAQKNFAAAYTGGDPMNIPTGGGNVAVSGAGAWVLDQAKKGGEGVHAFALSLANGYHTVTLMVLNDGSEPVIYWKDHKRQAQYDSAGLDQRLKDYAWSRYAYLMVEEYNNQHDPDVANVSDIPADKHAAVAAVVAPTVKKDIKVNTIAHLKPPAKVK